MHTWGLVIVGEAGPLRKCLSVYLFVCHVGWDPSRQGHVTGHGRVTAAMRSKAERQTGRLSSKCIGVEGNKKRRLQEGGTELGMFGREIEYMLAMWQRGGETSQRAREGGEG